MTYLSPETKKLLNSLQCPICQAPVDMIYYSWGHNRNHNFACAINNQHYSLALDQDQSPALILSERVHIVDKDKKYQLNKKYDYTGVGKITTEIIIYRLDPEGGNLFSFEQKKLILDKDLFDFSNFNKDKAVQRIKNILMFH